MSVWFSFTYSHATSNTYRMKALSPILSRRESLLFYVTVMANKDIRGNCRILAFDVVAEDLFRLSDVSHLLDKLQRVQIVFHSTIRDNYTGIVLTTDIAHEDGIFERIEPCFAIGNEASI